LPPLCSGMPPAKGSAKGSTSKRATGSSYRGGENKSSRDRYSRNDGDVKWETKTVFKPPKKIPDYALQKAKLMFFQLDRDSSGSIDAEELGLMLRSLGQNPTDEELNELINSVDGVDGEKDGKIQLREFLMLYASALGDDGEPAKAKTGQGDVDNVFMQFGGDRSNADSRIESADLLGHLTENFNLDVDLSDTFGLPRDGQLSKEDLAKMLGITAVP